MSNLSVFQLALLITFGLAIVIGVAIFAMFSGGSGAQQISVSVWGPFDKSVMNRVKSSVGLRREYPNVEVSYSQVDPERFDARFVNALAKGQGPDLVIIPHTKILRHADKLAPLPYSQYSKQRFTSTFVPGGEIFMRGDGITALPVTIDPMVMYRNRRMLSNNGIAQPPRTWSAFNTRRMRSLIDRDGTTINRSMIAFGEYDNVTNAKGILSTLFLQAGTPIVEQRGNRLRSMLGRTTSARSGLSSSAAVLNYYMQFADSGRANYSWNSAQPASRQAFLAEDLAFYFGFASEYDDLRSRNPNLALGVSTMPQRSADNGSTRTTFAQLHGLAVTRQAARAQGAFRVLSILTQPQALKAFAEARGLPPVQRAAVAEAEPEGRAMPVFLETVLWGRAWLDPAPAQTDRIFSRLVNAVQAGSLQVEQALNRARKQMDRLLP